MDTDQKSSRLYPTLSQTNISNNVNNNDLNKAEIDHPSQVDPGKNGANHAPNPDSSSGGEIKDCRYFWKRVLKDLTNKNLIPVKILFFFKYASTFLQVDIVQQNVKSNDSLIVIIHCLCFSIIDSTFCIVSVPHIAHGRFGS